MCRSTSGPGRLSSNAADWARSVQAAKSRRVAPCCALMNIRNTRPICFVRVLFLLACPLPPVGKAHRSHHSSLLCSRLSSLATDACCRPNQTALPIRVSPHHCPGSLPASPHSLCPMGLGRKDAAHDETYYSDSSDQPNTALREFCGRLGLSAQSNPIGLQYFTATHQRQSALGFLDDNLVGMFRDGRAYRTAGGKHTNTRS